METTIRKGMTIKHPIYGKGTVLSVEGTIISMHFPNRGNMDISSRTEGLEIVEEEKTEKSEGAIEMSDIEKSLRRILDGYESLQEIIPLGEKWVGGTMLLQPADASLKPKEIPIETFFHKIVLVRDRIRVMEQQINSNAKLSDEEKVDLQQYITRIYGSLTTFNILFKNSDHNFVGEKKS
ncbi:MAG: hypothetical protein WED33_06425 [Bacteroidia bacterium]